ncbi:prephenate dehydratase [Elusimicrobiota bacterium]
MKEIRKKIDEIDTKINELLDSRAKLARDIGRKKEETNKPVFSPSREKEILNKIILNSKSSKQGFPVEAKMNIFNEIFAASRSLQKELSISYLGPEATFTHLAAVRQFSAGSKYISVSSISQVFREVEKRRADYGVVPIENSTEGIVTHTLDMFMNSDCKICAEMLMEISHYLLSKEEDLSDVDKIYSHPQALAQCGMWLEENVPHIQVIEVSSTALAAKNACIEKGAAAIASSMAAKEYELNILEKRIEDISENITRFLVIGNEIAEASSEDKTTIMFSIKDRVGALHDMLVPFKKHSLNLTKIESRPSRAKAWEYVFVIDFKGHIDDDDAKAAVSELEKDCVFLKVLGSYPIAKKLFEKTE